MEDLGRFVGVWHILYIVGFIVIYISANGESVWKVCSCPNPPFASKLRPAITLIKQNYNFGGISCISLILGTNFRNAPFFAAPLD